MKNSIPYHQTFQKNLYGKDYFVGDLHGEYNKLFQLLNTINFNFQVDRLFSVGDLIDRGPNSFETLLLAKEKWFFPIIGNHEDILLHYNHEDKYIQTLWKNNGGSWWFTLSQKDKELAKKIIKDNFSYTATIPVHSKIIGIIHAEYNLNFWPITSNHNHLNDAIWHSLLWGRERLKSEQELLINGIDYLISGHTPLSNIKKIGQQIFIDTGAGHLPSNNINNPHLSICEYNGDAFIVHTLQGQIKLDG